MRVIGKKVISDFILKHPDSTKWLQAWLAEARSCEWQCPKDIKEQYNSASFLEDNMVVFNVKGNNYRMEVNVTYNTGIVLINRIGTHSEYDQWNK